MSKINEKKSMGFGAIELLLTLIFVAIVALIGVYVWNTNHNKKANSTSTALTSSTVSSTTNQNTSVIQSKLSQSPTNIQSAVMSTLKSDGCVNSSGQLLLSDGSVATDPNPGDITISYVINRGAIIHECGGVLLFSYSGGVWSYLTGGQAAIDCSTLQNVNFPSKVFSANGTQCYDTSTQSTVNYTN